MTRPRANPTPGCPTQPQKENREVIAQNRDPLYAVAEAAQYLSVAPSWLYRHWRAQGPTPLRIGGQLRWRQSALERWLDAQQVAA